MSNDHHWGSATTLAELGELVAQWLEGTVSGSPTNGRKAPDPETAVIARALARLNRLGVVTDFSQPATKDGSQRAAFSAYCSDETADKLMEGCWTTELVVLQYWPGWFGDIHIPISVDDGEPYTWLRERSSDDYIGVTWRGCSASLIELLRSSVQVAAFDPVWGRDDLLWTSAIAALE